MKILSSLILLVGLTLSPMVNASLEPLTPHTPADYTGDVRDLGIADLACAMETYGGQIHPLTQIVVTLKVLSLLEQAEAEYHPIRHTLRSSEWFRHIIDPAYPLPYITFDIPAIFVIAGYQNGYHLNFNPVYLNKYGAKFIDEVVTHEVAHLIAREKYEEESDLHGFTWQLVMFKLGARDIKPFHTMTFCGLLWKDNGPENSQ